MVYELEVSLPEEAVITGYDERVILSGEDLAHYRSAGSSSVTTRDVLQCVVSFIEDRGERVLQIIPQPDSECYFWLLTGRKE